MPNDIDRPPQDEDFLFPQLTSDGQIQHDKPFSVTQVSDLLNKYARNAGLMDHRYNQLDTHCFRRGGAQHRLIYAQDLWPFKAIKWWGGWSERDPAEKIIEYLLDESQYEAKFGDMMAPQGSKARSHSGAARHPAEVMVMKEHLERTIKSMESRHTVDFSRLELENQEIRIECRDLLQTIEQQSTVRHRELKQENRELRQEIAGLRRTITMQLEEVIQTLASRALSPTVQLCPQQESTQIQPQPPQYPPPQQSHEQQPSRQQLLQQLNTRALFPSSPSPQPLDLSQAQQPPRQQPVQHQQRPATPPDPPHQPYLTEAPQPLPPHLLELHQVQTIPGVSHWKDAIRQWEEGDPENGLMTPLHRWTAEMQGYNAAVINSRHYIVKEFEFFGRDEIAMRAFHGDSIDDLPRLVQSIHDRNSRLTRQSSEKRAADSDEMHGDDGQQHQHSQQNTNVQPVDNGKLRTDEDQQPPQSRQEEATERGTDNVKVSPIPRVFHWKDVIQQWDRGDPDRGLAVPLCKWTSAMIKQHRPTYFNRRTIAKEFERHGHSESRMQEVYGDVLNGGIHHLYKAIRIKRNSSMPGTGQDIEKERKVQRPTRHDDVQSNRQRWNTQNKGQQQEEMSPEQHHSTDDSQALKIPATSSWKEIVRQWDEGDPEKGLNVPLCNWTTAMIRSCYSAFYRRALIANEFDFQGRSADKMEETYGDSLSTPTRLVQAITERRRQRKALEVVNQINAQAVGIVPSEQGQEVNEKDGEGYEDVGPYMPAVPKITHWREAVEQWEEGDPIRGLTRPFRLWPKSWRVRSRVHQMYNIRKTIAEEFEFCGRDGERMRQLHGTNVDSVQALLESIHRRRNLSSLQVQATASEDVRQDYEEGEDEEPLIRKRRVTVVETDDAVSASKKTRLESS